MRTKGSILDYVINRAITPPFNSCNSNSRPIVDVPSTLQLSQSSIISLPLVAKVELYSPCEYNVAHPKNNADFLFWHYLKSALIHDFYTICPPEYNMQEHPPPAALRGYFETLERRRRQTKNYHALASKHAN